MFLCATQNVERGAKGATLGSNTPIHSRTMKTQALLLKVVIVGDSGIGKSSLLVRFADQTFAEGHKGD